MFDEQLAFLTMITIALAVLVGYLLVCVRALQRDIRSMMRDDKGASRDRRPAQSPPPPAAVSQPAPRQTRPAPVQTRPAPVQPTPQQTGTAPVQPAPRQTRPAPVRPAPAQPAPAPTQPAPAPEPERPRASVEQILGTRVLGILAALLVFAGLVFLAILVVPALTAELRCAAMFALSTGLVVGGVVACERKRSPFALALLGCGVGSMFASLLLTYVYFGFLSEAVMCALMLVWVGCCMLVATRYRSTALVVVAQVGMAISTCFAYAKGIRSDFLPLVAVYQLAASALVVVGCARSMRRGRLIGMFASLMVCVFVSQLVATVRMMSPWRVNNASTLVILAVQFVVASALWALVLADCHEPRTKTSPEAGEKTTPAAPPVALRRHAMVYHLLAEALWVALLSLDVVSSIMLASPLPTQNNNVQLAAGVALACVALRWAAVVVLQRKGVLHPRLGFATSVASAAEAALVLMWRMAALDAAGALPFVVAVAAAVWATGVATKDVRHRSGALLLLCWDAFLMCAGGYEAITEATGLPLAPLHVLFLDVLAFAWWTHVSPERREKIKGTALVTGILATELSLACAWGATDLHHADASLAAWTCVLALVAGIAFARPVQRFGLGRGHGIVLGINEVALVAIACMDVVGTGPVRYARESAAAAALAVGITLMCAGIVAYRLATMAARPQGVPKRRQVAYGILLTLWSSCAAEGLLPAQTGSLATVAAMLAALACTALGFARDLPSLRLYGLVAALLCVLKIVVVDVSTQDAIGRVVACIAGGIICFAMSALYTVAVRRLGNEGTKKG